MENSSENNRTISLNLIELGTVSPDMVQKRAIELALINGRTAQQVSPLDWEQAKRELTGGSEEDPLQTMLESVPESDRWNVVPGTKGHQAPESSGEEEDEEGRTASQRLVEEGVREAEHDQMKQASRKPFPQGN